MAFTEEQLQKLGLVKGEDGNYSRPKTRMQPRDKVKSQVDNFLPMTNCKVITSSGTTIRPDSPLAKIKKKVDPVHFNGMDIQDVYAQCEREGTIFIPGNVPSLKNSKQIFVNKKTGKSFITSSALYKKYVKESDIHWRIFKPAFLKMIEGKSLPYTIQFFFIRDKHKAFDYVNISQGPLDLMQAHGWLENDDNRNVIPDFSCGYGYDPKLAGTIIKIL